MNNVHERVPKRPIEINAEDVQARDVFDKEDVSSEKKGGKDVVAIMSGEDSKFKNFLEEKYKREVRNKTKKVVLAEIGKENYGFMWQYRATHHSLTPNLRNAALDLWNDPLFGYLIFDRVNKLREIGETLDPDNISKDQIDRLKGHIEKVKDLIQRPFLKKINVVEKKSPSKEEGVESDADPGNILWHMDRRSQNIKRD